MAMINDNLQYSALILGLQNEYLKSIIKNPSLIDIESKKFFNEIEKLCNEKIRLSQIDTELLEQNKGLFTIRDLNMVYQKYNDILDINGKIEKYNEKFKNNNNH